MNKWWLLLVLPALAGCASDGTKTGNGITLELAVAPEAPGSGSGSGALATVDASGTEFVLEEARLAVPRIDLEAPEGELCEEAGPPPGASCSNGGFRIEDDFSIDLVRRESDPPLDELSFPAGTYHRVDVEVAPLGRATELGAATFQARGSFVLDGVARSFELSLERNETLRYESADGIAVEDGEALVAALRVGDWFRALPITECLANGELLLEGDLLVIEDSGGCSELENAFSDALRASTELAR